MTTVTRGRSANNVSLKVFSHQKNIFPYFLLADINVMGVYTGNPLLLTRMVSHCALPIGKGAQCHKIRVVLGLGCRIRVRIRVRAWGWTSSSLFVIVTERPIVSERRPYEIRPSDTFDPTPVDLTVLLTIWGLNLVLVDLMPHST